MPKKKAVDRQKRIDSARYQASLLVLEFEELEERIHSIHDDVVHAGWENVASSLMNLAFDLAENYEKAIEIFESITQYDDQGRIGDPEPGITFVYCITGEYGVKIGYSKNPGSRLRALQTGNPDPTLAISWVMGFRLTKQAKSVEKALHRHFKSSLLPNTREWFACTASEVRRVIDWMDEQAVNGTDATKLL